jgi:hypothetical protein
MLFNYRYINHSIERFQVYLDHLVKEVWCKATVDFSLDLLHPDLKLIVEEITKDHLDGPIRRIYELFRTGLDAAQRQQVSDWYDHNNDIEAICACDPDKPPATYADIRIINADLETALKDFCKSLYGVVIGLKAVTSRIGRIDAHYDAFVTQNKNGKCPYCGCADIKGVYNTKREAYDHFLPKGIYPFNSVNFRNLAPMCQECNSTYKLAKDPIRKPEGTRRKAFYSYATTGSAITVSMTLKTKDVTKMVPTDIELHITAPGREEEVEAWKEVFGIEERYKAKLCAENDGKAWLQQIVEGPDNVAMTREQIFDFTLSNADHYPYGDANFLKKSFLIACRDAKII